MSQHVYENQFFDYIDGGAMAAAGAFSTLLKAEIDISSVLDIGCGRGAWLKIWKDGGVADVRGVDGDYVDTETLLIPKEQFTGHDLTKPVSFDRRFDIATSFEVAEHLPFEASDAIVDTLTQHADIVAFSAAVRGQGGEYHINEQPIDFWKSKFEDRGYAAYDFIRPHLHQNKSVERWYRFNALIYANEAGQSRLSQAVRETHVPKGQSVRFYGDLMWRLRLAVVPILPVSTATRIAQVKSKLIRSG